DIAVVRPEDVVGEAAALADLAEEARRHPAAEHGGEHLEHVAVGMLERVAADAEADVRLVRGLRVQLDRAVLAQLDRKRTARGRAFEVAEERLEPLEEVVPDLAADPDREAVGLVPAAEIVEEGLARRRADGLLAADDVP